LEVGIKGIQVPLVKAEECVGWALGRGCGGREDVSSEREGKNSMVYKGDGGNKEVNDKGE
jgi:hypothetical protein